MAYIRSEMKTEAKSRLKSNWGAIIGATVIVALVSGVISFVFYPTAEDVTAANYLFVSLLGLLGSLISLLVVAPLNLGMYGMLLDISNGQQVAFSDIFKGFRRIWSAVLITFLFGLFVFLWSLLLVIPGIIKTYSYAMAYFIFADDDRVKPLEAITKSRKMMNGHKWEFFVLQLSFIPWILLVAVTLGLGALYVAPYMNVTFANFYRRLKAENEVGAFTDTSYQTAAASVQPQTVSPEAQDIPKEEPETTAEDDEKAE
ncbi:MAG: DUF975 family protein [Bacillota bacterium]|nr:DUF975 family protein [Bacillota bacterium]